MITALVAPLVIPPAVYAMVASSAGLGIGLAVSAMWTQSAGGRPDLIVPLAMLAGVVVGVIGRVRR